MEHLDWPPIFPDRNLKNDYKNSHSKKCRLSTAQVHSEIEEPPSYVPCEPPAYVPPPPVPRSPAPPSRTERRACFKLSDSNGAFLTITVAGLITLIVLMVVYRGLPEKGNS